MEQSIKGNIVYTIANTFLGLIFPLITFPYISRVLQPEGVGLYNFYNAILGYVAMFANLGIALYATRLIARHRDDLHERSKITIEVFLLHCLTTLIASSAIFVLAWAVPRIYEHQMLFFVMATSIVLGPLSVNWFYQGVEEFKYITIRSLGIKALSMVLLLTFVKTHNDVIIYAIISVLANIGNYFFNIAYLRKFISLRGLRWGDLEVMRHLKPCLTLFVLNVVISVYVHLDSIMLGFLQSDAAVGYYSVPVRLSHIVLSIITSIGTALLPRFSYLLEAGNIATFNTLCRKSMLFIMGISLPVMLGLIILSKSLVICLFGLKYAPSILVLQLLSPIVFFASITNVLGIQILYPKGKENLVIYSTLGAAVVNFTLNCVFIPIYSYNGAAIATCIAEAIVLVLQIYLGKHYLPPNLFPTRLWSLGVAGGIMGLLVWSVTLTAMPQWLHLLVGTAVGITSYFALLLWFKNELALSILSMITNKLKRTA